MALPVLLQRWGGVFGGVPGAAGDVAMPVFLLEVAVGQRFRSTPVPIWSAIHPALCGLGWAATVSSYVTAWYYNVIDAWSLYYLGASVLGPRPSAATDPRRRSWTRRGCRGRSGTARTTSMSMSMSMSITTTTGALLGHGRGR